MLGDLACPDPPDTGIVFFGPNLRHPAGGASNSKELFADVFGIRGDTAPELASPRG